MHSKLIRLSLSSVALLALFAGAPHPSALSGASLPATSKYASASARAADRNDAAAISKQDALNAYSQLPITFIPNAGQLRGDVRYYAQGSGYAFAFTPMGVRLGFESKNQADALSLNFVKANPNSVLKGEAEGPGRVNYLIGDRGNWRTGLPTFGRIAYKDLWPGIDMVFRGEGSRLIYELMVKPGGRVDNIRLQYAGANSLSVDGKGSLVMRTSLGMVKDERPLSYQLVGNARVPVSSAFEVAGAGQFGLAVGNHDPHLPLVIDPGLIYSSYLGGSSLEIGNAIAVDSTGHAYVTGQTLSTNFPTTPGAFDNTYNGCCADAFVTKFNSSGSALDYSTYLGGNLTDVGYGIRVDSLGEAFVTGSTQSANFPTTPGAFQTTQLQANDVDAFVTKLNSTGSALVYSTRLGGHGGDVGYAIQIDALGDAYVTGATASRDFPTTPLAFDTTFNQGGFDAFVTKLNPFGTAPLLYSTFLGGSGYDQGTGIDVDTAGDAYVTGFTASLNFPTTPTSFDITYNGSFDAFVTKLNPAGSAPLYSTYLGGSGSDMARGIVIDSAVPPNAYVTGSTGSANFPTMVGSYDITYNGGGGDAFVTKLNGLGTAPLLYSTYLGGSNYDEGRAIALDSSGDAHVTGLTLSSNFPTTSGAFDTHLDGFDDAFLTKFNATGSLLLYSTYLGGSNYDDGYGVALDGSGAVYLTGDTGSTNFPTTTGAFDTTYNSGGDAFVTKLLAVGAPAHLDLMPVTATNMVGQQHCVTATVTDSAGQPVPGVTVIFSVPTAAETGASPASGSFTTNSAGQATFCYTATLPGVDTITAFADTNNNGQQDVGEPFGVATKIWTPPLTSGTCKITDSGWITAINGDRGDFSGEVHVAGGQASGHETYQDRGPVRPERIQSTSLLAVVCPTQVGRAAQIYGHATVNGMGDFVFLITVTDGGNGGSNDTYGIMVSDGYVSGQQPLGGGNINIR